MVGAYADGAAHAMYFVVDATSADQVRLGLEPIIDQGTADIRPVTEFGKVAEERAKG